MSADLEQKINTSKTEPAGIVSGSEEDYVSPATKEKRAIFNNILKNVSEKLDNTSSRSYLVINTVDGLSVEAIFSSHEAAEKYLNRIAINFSTDLYCENCKDAQTQPTEDGFLTFVREMISDNYKILHVHHLDLSNKVYKVQNGNYLCYGETSKYLKNSVEEWKAENISRFGTCANSFNKDWLEQCTVKINPPLPELQCNYY